jgi:alginate O-acetyltransferase complex protein AlgJ
MVREHAGVQTTMKFADRTTLTRRRLMAGLGGALALSAGQSRAAIVNMCVVGKDGWLFPIWDEVRRVDLGRLHRVTQTMNATVDALRAAKIEVAFALIPAKSRVYREFLPDDFKMSAEADHRYGAALADLAHSGAVVPDFAAMFAALRKVQPDAGYFFKADTHWTTAGSEPAAIELARQIKAKGHLPPSREPGTGLGAPVSILQERNDLAALLPAAEQAQYPFQRYNLRSPVASSAQAGLLGDDAADVIVIGNSFMQPNYGFTGMLSNQLGRPVALDWKVHQYSPYWLLLNFVRSAAFKKQRPAMIVWNFEEADLATASDDSGAWGPNAMPPSAFLSGLRAALGA